MITRALLLLLAALSLAACTSTTTSTSQVNTTQSEVRPANDEIDEDQAAANRLSLGLRYLQSGQMEKAKLNLDKAYEYRPKSGDVLFGLAYYYQFVNEYEEADRYYRRAIREDKNSALFLNGYGAFLCARGKYDKADDYFNRAIENPRGTQVDATYENAGICALEDGKLKDAEGYLRKALSHNPRRVKALLEMADIQFQKGDYSLSEAYLLRYARVARPSPRSLWLGYQVSKALGDQDGMSNNALRLERLYPDSEQTAELREILKR